MFSVSFSSFLHLRSSMPLLWFLAILLHFFSLSLWIQLQKLCKVSSVYKVCELSPVRSLFQRLSSPEYTSSVHCKHICCNERAWTVAYQVPLPMEFSRHSTGEDSHSLLQGSSQPRDWTLVSHIAGRFFTIWKKNPGKPIKDLVHGKFCELAILCCCCC